MAVIDAGWVVAIAGNAALAAGFILDRRKHDTESRKREGQHEQVHEQIVATHLNIERRIAVLEQRAQMSSEAIARFDEKQSAMLDWIKRIATKLDIT